MGRGPQGRCPRQAEPKPGWAEHRGEQGGRPHLWQAGPPGLAQARSLRAGVCGGGNPPLLLMRTHSAAGGTPDLAGVRRRSGAGSEVGGLPPSLCLEALLPGTVGLGKDTPLIAARWLLPHSALDAGHAVVCAGGRDTQGHPLLLWEARHPRSLGGQTSSPADSVLPGCRVHKLFGCKSWSPGEALHVLRLLGRPCDPSFP